MVAWVVELWGQVEAWLLALVDSVWALPTLFATTAGDGFFPPIPGETVIVMLAVGAQSGGGVAWGLVLLVAALGAWCGDQLAYALGRALGTRALPALRGPRGQRAVAWATRSLDRRGASVVLGARFVPVGRTAVNVTAGAVGFSRRRFMALSAVASVAWATYSV
ncbi:DedA family protein, partial [Cellulosimicrobium cellulans]